MRNKADLVTALAEAILRDVGTLQPPPDSQPWQEWLIDIAGRLRRAMFAHPDGARVVSAAHLSTRMAGISELAMSTLVARGLPLQQARLTVLVVERFAIGHVLEEQSPPPDPEAVAGFDAEDLARRYPTVTAGIIDYFQQGRTAEDLFRDGLELLLNWHPPRTRERRSSKRR